MDTLMRDQDLEALAGEVARLEGTSVAEAVRRALEQRKARLEVIRGREQALDRIIAEVRKLPDLDPRDHGEMLYDEYGIPK